MPRLPFFLLLALLSFSCANKKEAPKPDETKETGRTDSNTVNRPENNINAYSPVDISPMDMSYYPVDYPKLKMSDSFSVTSPKARVIYSRPHLQGRHIFHEVLKYGEPWRLGANEETELDLYTDASIGGQRIKAGRYVIYCIPQQKEWTIVLNSNTDAWGLHPDPSRDIARFTVPVIETANSLEFFTMVFEGMGSKADLLMAWDNVEIKLPIQF